MSLANMGTNSWPRVRASDAAAWGSSQKPSENPALSLHEYHHETAACSSNTWQFCAARNERPRLNTGSGRVVGAATGARVGADEGAPGCAVGAPGGLTVGADEGFSAGRLRL
mmetsp:Transcript_22282/g.44645  ORF Transcript_22282/g.44645 Transcript_22282/m.44645 type:complete len:112 (-) Transcript_22282:1239-1574(-)